MPFNKAINPFINVYWQMATNQVNTDINLHFKAHISHEEKIKTTYYSFHSHYLQNGEVVFKKIK